MNIRFYLNRPDEKKTSIMAYITFDSKRIRCSTGNSCKPQQWSNSKERIKGSSMQSTQINSELQNFKAFIEAEYSKIKALEVKNKKDYLTQKIKQHLNPKKYEVPKTADLLEAYRQFIEERRADKQRYSDGIIKVYQATKRRLIEYQKSKKITLKYENIGNEFYVGFTNYLSKIGLTDTSVGKHIKTFKTFMNYAVKKGWTDNLEFREFKVVKRDADTIALTEEEIRRIENLDLKGKKVLERTRDLFLVQCYTGVRYSDLIQVNGNNINKEERTIAITTQKTKERILLPLHEKLEKIMRKYDYDLPKIHNIVQNRNLKVIAEMANIDETIEKRVYKSGRAKVEIYKKCELVTTHTARRTYITLLIKKGVIPELVMRTSGHRDNRILQQYVRTTQREAVKQIRNIWNEVK